MRNITLKQLRYFEALSKMENFGRAADLCSVTQPALSLQIKELETELGQALVERGPRRTYLTPFGEKFAQRAGEILRAVDDLGDLAREAGEGMTGILRFGIIPTIAPYLLPQILQGVAGEFPDLTLKIRESMTQNLVQELQDGSLDVALVALPLNEPALHEEDLYSESLLLVRAAGLETSPVTEPHLLDNENLLLLEEGHCFREHSRAVCNLSVSNSSNALAGSSLTTLVQMVSAKLGVTLIPEMACQVETQNKAVAVSRFMEPQPQRRIGLVWRKTSPMTDHFRALGQIIAKIGKQHQSATDHTV